MKTYTEFVSPDRLSKEERKFIHDKWDVEFIPTSTVNRLDICGTNYRIGMDEEAFAEAMQKYMDKHEPKFYKLTCQGCGASINQKMNDHILKCPYCKSVYAIGTKMVNMRC